MPSHSNQRRSADDELAAAKRRLREAAERLPAGTLPGSRAVQRHPFGAMAAAFGVGLVVGHSKRARRTLTQGLPRLLETMAMQALERAVRYEGAPERRQADL